MVYVCSATRSFPWSLTAADFERIHMTVEPGGVQEAAQATAAVLVALCVRPVAAANWWSVGPQCVASKDAKWRLKVLADDWVLPRTMLSFYSVQSEAGWSAIVPCPVMTPPASSCPADEAFKLYLAATASESDWDLVRHAECIGRDNWAVQVRAGCIRMLQMISEAAVGGLGCAAQEVGQLLATHVQHEAFTCTDDAFTSFVQQ